MLRDRRAAGLISASIAAGLLSTCCTVVWLLLLATTIDRAFLDGAGLDGAALGGVGTLLGAMVVVLLVRSACTWAIEWFADAASGRLRSSVRDELVEHLAAVGPGGLDRERVGEVATTIGAGVDSLHDYVTRFLPAAALAVASPLIVFLAVLVLDPWTTLILLFTGPMLVLLLAVIGGRTRAMTRRRFDELGWLAAFYLDMIRGLGTLKAFGRAEEGAETIEGVSRRYGDTTMEVLRTAFQTSLVMEWAATAATALAAVEISFRMIEGDLPFSTGLAVLVLVPEFFVPFRRLAIEYHAGQSGQAALERIDALQSLPVTAPRATEGDRSAPRSALTIELRDVRFTYPGATSPALDGLDLRLGAGETVALVGPSGAGKTTVSRLLLRFIDADGGEVAVDGVPLASLDLADWRSRVAWVPQDPTVISGTVADNIRLGDPTASDERVRAAAQVARATEFVERLPDGFDTVLGERGLRLSGGQRQRLAIARAALRDAPVVILDEFTAHLDDGTEIELLEGMAELLRDRTALVIAHRRRTAQLADRVVRLVDGRVEGSGDAWTTGDRGAR